MSPTSRADVIVPVGRDRAMDPRCLESVLERSGPALNRLIVVNDGCPDPELAGYLRQLAGQDGRVRILANERPIGIVGSLGRGLALREGDAVLLSPDVVVADGWLDELAAVAHSEERTACAAPLTNVGGPCSVPEPGAYRPPDAIDEEMVRAACAGLPRWTVAPTVSAACVYLRGDVIDAVGPLDAGSASACDAVDRWVERARALGFVARRANHAYVRGSTPEPPRAPVATSAESVPDVPESDEDRLGPRTGRFLRTLDGRLAAHAVGMTSAGRLRVAYDLRYLPDHQVGTRTYGACLAQAMGRIPEVDLTLIVREPAQADGLAGRVVTEEEWADDVALIHRPAQIFDRRELKLLFGSSAHLAVTFLDLIGYRIPAVFPTEAEFDGYRATSSLTLPAVQKVVAISENAAAEIAAEFGVPREEIAVATLGVESGWFSHREPVNATGWSLGLPPRYFLSLATDYPHKNLANLIDAYARLRDRWGQGEPPGLLLAGHATTAPGGLYRRLQSGPMGAGVTFLGPVTGDQLRVLYQDALALVYPSLYEGFGLPPLEAMAAGTPVIAMPISSVPEVVGDCALYPAGLSSDDLARAMESVARDDDLRRDLRERGLRRAERFRWDRTARATLDAYRSAILEPSPRSLRVRRHLEDALRSWGEPAFHAPPPPIPEPTPPELVGIRTAWQALHASFRHRVRKELERWVPQAGRRSA